jgi:hypothetical protein
MITFRVRVKYIRHNNTIWSNLLHPLTVLKYWLDKKQRYKKRVGHFPLKRKISEHRNKWKAHLQRMEHTRIPLQAYQYQPSGKRDIGRPRRRWRETTILQAGTGDSLNPWSDDDDSTLWSIICGLTAMRWTPTVNNYSKSQQLFF